MVAFFETLFDLLHLLDCRKLPLPMLSLPIHSISQLSNLEPAAGPPVAGEDVKKIVNLKQQKIKRR